LRRSTAAGQSPALRGRSHGVAAIDGSRAEPGATGAVVWRCGHRRQLGRARRYGDGRMALRPSTAAGQSPALRARSYGVAAIDGSRAEPGATGALVWRCSDRRQPGSARRYGRGRMALQRSTAAGQSPALRARSYGVAAIVGSLAEPGVAGAVVERGSAPLPRRPLTAGCARPRWRRGAAWAAGAASGPSGCGSAAAWAACRR